MAVTGQGSLSNQQHTAAAAPPGPPGPPFLLTSANNGLSVDPVTGKIVLGNDAGLLTAALLSNREIPLSGFFINNKGALIEEIIDDTLGRYHIQDAALNQFLFIDPVNNLFELGDINGSNTGTTLILNDAVQLSRITSASGNRLFLDALNGLYQMGDIDGFGNGIFFGIDDVNQIARIRVNSALDDMLFLNFFSGDYAMGDASTGITVNRTNSFITILLNRYLSLDPTLALYEIGDIDSANNSSRLTIDDTQVSLMFSNGSPGSRFLDLNRIAGSYLFGDIDNVYNNMFLFIDGAGNRISTNGFAEMIGTTTAYTNNAAAAAATLLNAPVAGNPTNWIPINDNGTIRNIPAW